MRTQSMSSRSTDPFEAWLGSLPEGRSLATLGACLRAATGGGGASQRDPEIVGRYFRPGRRSAADLLRLCDDVELRRSVASIGRVLAASESVRAERQLGERLGRRWLGLSLLVAASIAGLLVFPALLDEGHLDNAHRSTIVPSTEVRIVAPTSVAVASPRIEWHPVLGAEVYELELTDAQGRTVFSERTTETSLNIPVEDLDPGASYFFRVRAQLDVARWITSDFKEIVAPK